MCKIKKTILKILGIGICVAAGLNLVMNTEVGLPEVSADIIIKGTRIRFSGGQTIEALDGELLFKDKNATTSLKEIKEMKEEVKTLKEEVKILKEK